MVFSKRKESIEWFFLQGRMRGNAVNLAEHEEGLESVVTS
jgi:hypothetical protein